MSGEKRHPPSQKTLREARKEGKSLKSPLLAGLASLTICIIMVLSNSEVILVKNQMLLQYLSGDQLNQPLRILQEALECVFLLTLCFVVPCVAMGTLMEALQVGFKVEPAVLNFKIERLNPASGMLNLWRSLCSSWSYLLRAVSALLALLGLLLCLADRLPPMMNAFGAGGAQLLQQVCLVGIAMLALFCALEYALRRREFNNAHGLSDEELRREFKELEGDPILRGYRRAQHESLLFEQLVKRIRASKCVVVEKI